MTPREAAAELRRIATTAAASGSFSRFSSEVLNLAGLISASQADEVLDDSDSDPFLRIAARVSGRKKPKPSKSKKPVRGAKPRVKAPPVPDNVTMPVTEYSCQMEFSITADFEGSVDRAALLAKLKRELVSSMEAGVKLTARAYGLRPTTIKVRPLSLECAVSDNASVDDEFDR